MKNVFLTILFSISIFPLTINAQDAKSTPIVTNLTEKIQKSTGVKADFIMTYYDAKNVKQNTISGKLKIKGDSYMVDMNSHKIYCDGNDVINYLVADKEIQLSKYNKNDLLSPSQLFSASLQSNFTYKYFSKTLFAGKNVSVIEFTPKKSNKTIKNMHLFVDEKNNVLGGKFFDNKGGYYYYTLANINMNSNLKASEFTLNYKAIAGVEIIDLR